MNLIGTLILLLLVIVLAAFAAIYLGVYNVGVLNHDNPAMNWILDTSMERSVKHHAQGIAVPALTDRAMIRTGFHQFDAMCAECHGAPGVKPKEIAHGLWPEAPDLSKTASDWKPEELYWIIKNGIKFTGMPAWGPSHSEEDLWALTAFVRTLPAMSASTYAAMRDSTTTAGLK